MSPHDIGFVWPTQAAIGSGTDVAAETADIIWVNNDPKDVVQMIEFGRKTNRKMIKNLAWAVVYNVIEIPLGAGVLHPTFLLGPAMGAVLMSLSTVIIAINAKRLKLKFSRVSLPIRIFALLALYWAFFWLVYYYVPDRFICIEYICA